MIGSSRHCHARKTGMLAQAAIMSSAINQYWDAPDEDLDWDQSVVCRLIASMILATSGGLTDGAAVAAR
jgi:hypothetical protein